MNIYYVYFYLREDYTPYYVGKGTGKRAWKKHKNEIKPPKDKNKIIVMKNNISLIEAFYLERYYIRWFGRKDMETGILRNKTDGGEGVDSKTASKYAKKMVEEKTHPFLKREDGTSWGSDVNRRKAINGTHPFSKSDDKNSVYQKLTLEERQRRGRKGGIIAGKLTLEKKIGIHGMSKEKQLESAIKGGKAIKGIPKSESMKNKLRQYIWVRNETETKKIKIDEVIPNGWWKGRITKWQEKETQELYENV